MLDHNTMHERHGFDQREVKDVVLIGACQPLGGAHYHMSQRFTRHFQTCAVAVPSEEAMSAMFLPALGTLCDCNALPTISIVGNHCCLGSFQVRVFDSQVNIDCLCSWALRLEHETIRDVDIR